MHDLPKERKIFFFTDMEGSTRIAQRLGEAYAPVLERYRAVIRSAVGHHRGREIDTAGDGFFAVFSSPDDAILAAIAAQRAFVVEALSGQTPLKIRMGIHEGEAILTPNGGFIGLEVHRASRVCNAAHGGQVLLSDATAAAVRTYLPEGVTLKDQGECRLKDFDKPERLHQLIIPGVPADFPPPRTITQTHIIAVLPFRNTMGEAKWDNFCEGMAEEIIVALGKIQGIQVISRAAAFALRHQSDDIKAIGRQLNATVVLSGSVRVSGRRLRIGAELIATDTGINLWSGSYNQPVEDIFTVQDDISGEIASALKVKLVSRQVRNNSSIQTSNINAYDAYLRGRRFYEQFSRQGIEFAIKMFQQAIEEDDHYALAHCGLADCYSYLYLYVEDSEAHLQTAQLHSNRALELDPLLAKAHVSRGIALSLNKQYAASEASFERAIALDPRFYEAWYWYGRVAFTNGNLEKAARLFERANQLLPADYQSALLAGQVYADLGQPEKAEHARKKGIAMAEKALDINPADTRALYLGANGLAALHERERAMQWLQRALTLEPNDAMIQYNAACIYALLGMQEEALNCLEQSIAQGLSQKGWFEHDSNLDSLRALPRFTELQQQLQ